MSAPTAGSLLAALARRRFAAELALIGELADLDNDAVERALTSVSPRARVDVPTLVQTLRAETVARAEAEAARIRANGSAVRYELSLLSQGELKQLRGELRAKVDRGEGSEPWNPPVGSAAADILGKLERVASRLRGAGVDEAQPDDDVDDEAEPTEPRRSIPRRSIPRRRLRRQEPAGSVLPARAEFLMGPRLCGPADDRRPYGCPVGADYERWANPSPPAWLISDDGGQDVQAS